MAAHALKQQPGQHAAKHQHRCTQWMLRETARNTWMGRRGLIQPFYGVAPFILVRLQRAAGGSQRLPRVLRPCSTSCQRLSHCDAALSKHPQRQISTSGQSRHCHIRAQQRTEGMQGGAMRKKGAHLIGSERHELGAASRFQLGRKDAGEQLARSLARADGALQAGRRRQLVACAPTPISLESSQLRV